MKPGTRFWSTVSPVSVVVVRPAAGKVTLTCGGVPMAEHEPENAAVTAEGEGPLLGKRYADEDSGLQILCTRGGAGELAVDGRPLQLMNTRPLPASD
ncbi:hypothetical protein ABZ918_06760 [Streptomyces viridosporus]|uniref:hypothetical protein n=1 Tax=Streptomyces viridosporus TaxID=67581 RepID=UPI00341454D2